MSNHDNRRVLFDTDEDRQNRKPTSRLRAEAAGALAQAQAYDDLARAADELIATLTTPDYFKTDGETAVYSDALRCERNRLRELQAEMVDDAASTIQRIADRS